jgi:uncharacterized protein with von Willebrand factor type A (vWA) domain
MRAVTNIDTMDRELYDHVKDRSSRVKKYEADRPEETFKDLLEDAFGTFYKYSPRVLDKVDADRELSRQLIKQAMELDEYKLLRNYSVGDAVVSLGALDVVKDVLGKLPKPVKDAQKNLEQVMETLRDFIQDTDFRDPGAQQDLQEQGEKVKCALQNLQAQFAEHQDGIRAEMRVAVREAAENAEQTNETCKALGWGTESGELRPVPMDQKIEIAKALARHQQLQDIMRLAGRIIRIAERKQVEKSLKHKQYRDGITQGSNFAEALPSELAGIVIPLLKPIFLRNLANSSFRQYKLKGKVKKGKGTVIMGIDCSGSMEGFPDQWSKATALAMFMIARRQHRAFVAFLFNYGVVRTVAISKGEKDPQKMIALLTDGCNGGTNFDAALERALELVEEDPYNESDIIFITDGQCCTSQAVVDKVKETQLRKKFSLYSILIGKHSRDRQELERFSNKVVDLEGLVADNEGKAFDAVFTI